MNLGSLFSRGAFRNFISTSKRAAHLLPTEYFCHEKWDDSLRSDVMQINLGTYMEQIDQNLKTGEKVTATKMDVLASKLVYANSQDELEFAEDILRRFRATREYRKIPESYSHGLIRSYIDVQQAHRLLPILQDKSTYGIFLDKFTGNMLMDTFLDENKFEYAMKVAAEIALQEETVDRLTGTMAIISTLQYVQSEFQTFFSGWTVEPHKEPENDDEIERVKVAFIPNFTYDDHFDIRSSKLLSGKAIEYFNQFVDKKHQTSIKLLGNILHEDCLACKSIVEGDKNIVSNLCMKALHALMASEPTPLPYIDGNQMVNYPPFKCNDPAESNEEAMEKLKVMLSCTEIPVEDQCKSELNNLISSCVDRLKSFVEQDSRLHQLEMKTLISEWIESRTKRVNNETRRAQLRQRRDELLAKLDDLERQEEELTFFDNQSKIEMHYAEAEFADESPLLVEVHGEKEFNEKYRKFFRLDKLEPRYYVVHRHLPKPQPPMFRVGAVDFRKLNYTNLKIVEPEPERIM